MASLEKITYQEDPDTLEWIDRTAAKVSAHRGGSSVSRAEVIRWLTRQGRAEWGGLPDDAIASQV